MGRGFAAVRALGFGPNNIILYYYHIIILYYYIIILYYYAVIHKFILFAK